MRTKKYCKYLFICILSFCACSKDKGNYTYTEMEELSIEIPTKISVMANTEYITLNPKIHSSLIGDISEDNPNFTFKCKIGYEFVNKETGERDKWTDLNPDGEKAIHYLADFPANIYTLWYSVTNTQTGITKSVDSKVEVLSSTFEGWMVLSNVGSEDSVRLDMIFKHSSGENLIAKNLLGEEANNLFHATQIFFFPSKFSKSETVYLMSESGAYKLNEETLKLQQIDNVKALDFLLPNVSGEPVSMEVIQNQSTSEPLSKAMVMNEGDAYAIRSTTAGAAFEYLMNTDNSGNEATYKVAPAIGVSMSRPGNSTCALFYDVTNKRFMGWNYEAKDNRILMKLSNPDNPKFSYHAQKDFISMKSTRFSSGLVYTVLQDDAGQRSIYGINLSGNQFTQESYYPNINAEHFNDATDYAFHSQYPLLFYSYQNKVYSYNLGSGKFNGVLTLDNNETVTMLKFNLFHNMDLSELNDQNQKFMDQQFNLIVASTTGNDNGGIIRFYTISSTGEMLLKDEYKGFGKIVDVTYRERRR